MLISSSATDCWFLTLLFLNLTRLLHLTMTFTIVTFLEESNNFIMKPILPRFIDIKLKLIPGSILKFTFAGKIPDFSEQCKQPSLSILSLHWKKVFWHKLYTPFGTPTDFRSKWRFGVVFIVTLHSVERKSACATIRRTPSNSISWKNSLSGQNKNPASRFYEILCSQATKRLSFRFPSIMILFVPLPSSL